MPQRRRIVHNRLACSQYTGVLKSAVKQTPQPILVVTWWKCKQTHGRKAEGHVSSADPSAPDGIVVIVTARHSEELLGAQRRIETTRLQCAHGVTELSDRVQFAGPSDLRADNHACRTTIELIDDSVGGFEVEPANIIVNQHCCVRTDHSRDQQ